MLASRRLLLLIILSHLATNTHVLYKKKSCHDGFIESVSLAVTYNAEWESEEWDEEEREYVYSYENRPTQLQLCPWFIDCKLFTACFAMTVSDDDDDV